MLFWPFTALATCLPPWYDSGCYSDPLQPWQHAFLHGMIVDVILTLYSPGNMPSSMVWWWMLFWPFTALATCLPPWYDSGCYSDPLQPWQHAILHGMMVDVILTLYSPGQPWQHAFLHRMMVDVILTLYSPGQPWQHAFLHGMIADVVLTLYSPGNMPSSMVWYRMLLWHFTALVWKQMVPMVQILRQGKVVACCLLHLSIHEFTVPWG